jgi:DTW domain-containing protein
MPACPDCLLPVPLCLCAELPRLATRTSVVIVRHVLEAHRRSNSARIVARVLSNSCLIDYGGRGGQVDAGLLRAAGSAVLFPAWAGRRLPPGERPSQLVVLDGSWPQARRMWQRIGALRGLPVWPLPPGPPPPPQLRRSPRPDGLSTLEAVARALAHLDGPDVARLLRQSYDLLMARCRAARQPPAAATAAAANR